MNEVEAGEVNQAMIIARRGTRLFLNVVTPHAQPGDQHASAVVVDVLYPDLEPIEMPVGAILKQGYWEPARDADRVAARQSST